jgi:DNA replication protein DnaC
MLKDLIRTVGVRGRFLDFTSFLARIQSTFDPTSEESKHRLLHPVLNAELLLFDELGAQKPTPFVQDILYLIINTRYANRRTTLFTTNYLLKEPSTSRDSGGMELDEPLPFDLSSRPLSKYDLLVERLSPKLVSRVREMARPVPINAEDYRSLAEERRR